MSLPSALYRPVITAAVNLVGLPFWRSWSPAVWFEALVMQESGGNPRARRYEAHHDRAADGDAPDMDDGALEDDASYGLTQVLGTNIRALCGVAAGVPMNFGFALLPLTNIALGLRVVLGELKATNGSVGAALARYNGGSTGDDLVDGYHYRRQVYVDGVAGWADRVAKDAA